MRSSIDASMTASPETGGLDILQVGGLDLSSGFLLTGDAYLDVGFGSGSNPAFQVKFGSGSAPVPEPSTMILLGAGLLGFIGVGRKRFRKP